jgi:hypothetical protein
MSRTRVLGIGIWSVLAIGFVTANLPACGGSDTSGLGTDDSGSTDTSEAGDGGSCAYATSFVFPAALAKLGTADDKSGLKCAGGLVTDVSVATAAPDGTAAVLFANDKQVGTGAAAGAKVVFAGVSLPSSGSVVLRVSVGGFDCTSESISVDCGLPACAIASPKGPYLNGAPVASGGDRVNNASDPFATKVVVDTDLADGELVTLSIDGTAPLTVAASGGHASFAAVTMSPDGAHNAKATCTNSIGNAGSSGLVQYTVLTSAVDLALTKPTADGRVFGVADDVDSATPGIQFDLCGTTTDTNAIDVPADARNGQKNFCAGIGTATPNCVSMTKPTAGAGGSACVRMTCPTGSAPFDVNATLSDKAGNQATAKRASIRCESSLPSVAIVSPVAYDSSKPATILNLATGEPGSLAGTLKKTVVACTDKFPAKAQLFAGLAGGPLSALGAAVDVSAATAADNCSAGLGYVAKIVQTLPESVETRDGKGTLVTASELRVDVTDLGANVGTSPKVDLWVDSIPPQLLLSQPACGKVYTGASVVADTVKVTTDAIPITFKVTGSAATGTYPATTFDSPPLSLPWFITIPNVSFYVGGSDLSLTATDAAGNATSALSGCKTYVGTPPVLSITAPVDGTKFGADGNVDAATHSYKTSVTGTVTGTTSATTVTLKLAGAVVGTAPISGGTYSFSNVLLPESDALALTVELSDTNYGTVGRTETVVVDTHAPTTAGSLTAAVDGPTRRAGGFALSWTAGSDYSPVAPGSRACDHYEVRRAGAPISTEAAWTAAVVVSSSIGGSVTSSVAKLGRLPASSNFAVRCVDKVGNLSPIVSTSAAVSADFIQGTLKGPSGISDFGNDVGGSLDVSGDGTPDLVVGSTSGKAFVYFGHTPTGAADSGFSATPSLTLTGAGYFGFSVTDVGDFDGDGRNDLAIAAPLDGNGKTFVVSGLAIVAQATDVPISSLTARTFTIAGDASTSLFGLRVRDSGNFFGGGGSIFLRSRFGGNFGFALVKSRPLAGASLTLPAGADLLVGSATATTPLAYASAAQDVDGDGLTDLLFGDSDAATIYLFKGRAASSSTALTVAAADGKFVSPTPTDAFGQSIGLPGKITGTRFDAVVGAVAADGRQDVLQVTGTTMARSASFSGTATGSGFGYSTIELEPGQTFDADRDGIADILGCSFTPAAANSACYLTYGANPLTSGSVSAYAKSFAVDSTKAVVVHSLGDVDGDGFTDFALCSPNTGSCLLVR